MDEITKLKADLTIAQNTIKRLLAEINDIKLKADKITELTICTNNMANNITHMVEQLKKQSERLERLEREPLQEFKKYKALIITTVISAILTLVIGLVLGTNTIIHGGK